MASNGGAYGAGLSALASEYLAAFNRATFEQLIAGKTVIMIAHRLSTVEGADQVVVMGGGRTRHEPGSPAVGPFAAAP